MKMKPKHYEQLKAAIEDVIKTEKLTPQEYKDQNGFSDTRTRWDFLWKIPGRIRQPLMDTFYLNDLNDDHIDTALRHIMPL